LVRAIWTFSNIVAIQNFWNPSVSRKSKTLATILS
jgi:hypothetical protein